MQHPPSIADLPPPQRGRAAWRGEALAQAQDWHLELDAPALAELEAATARLLESGADLTALDAAQVPLPTLASRIALWRAELLHGRGFILVHGLPVERYARSEVVALFLALGAHLGKARSQNAKGHVLGHVCDLGLSSSDPNVRIYQTRERQTFHTDSCDIVGLLCLREARRGGDSLLVSAHAIFNELRATAPELLARLLRPMAHDRRGEVPEGQAPWFPMPVFSWFAEELTVFYQRQYFDSAQRFADAPRLTAEDVAALDAFDALANDARLVLPMRLAPGDMQFVHNHALLHDRTAFEDWPEPERHRHLLRLWLASPDARALPPWFAARYGTVTVGDRGGVVVRGTRLNVPLEPV